MELLVVYGLISLSWLCAWGIYLDETSYGPDRMKAAWMMLLCWAWPLLLLLWAVIGVLHLFDIALGKEKW